MDHLLEFLYSEHNEAFLDVDIQILQAWLMVTCPSKFYTVSTVLFHKYVGANVAVTNWMSHFSIFVPTKATVKMANVNMGRVQGIWIFMSLS